MVDEFGYVGFECIGFVLVGGDEVIDGGVEEGLFGCGEVSGCVGVGFVGFVVVGYCWLVDCDGGGVV